MAGIFNLGRAWTGEDNRRFRRGLTKYDAWRENWIVRIPLWQAEECPECGALCIGQHAKQMHKDDHIDRREFEKATVKALRDICKEVGLTTQEAYNEEGEYGEEYEEESSGYVL